VLNAAFLLATEEGDQCLLKTSVGSDDESNTCSAVTHNGMEQIRRLPS
jgi:hypothetical protein